MDAPRIGYTALGNYPWNRAFDVAGDLDVDFVELPMNHYPADRLLAEASTVREAADRANVGITVHLPHGDDDLMIASSDADVRRKSIERFRTVIDAAGTIGADIVVAHIDALNHRNLVETDEWETLVDVVDDLAGYATDRDMTLSVENMLASNRRRLRPDDVARLASETDVAMTFDTGHARTIGYSQADIVAFLGRHGERVRHIHLNETRGPRDEHLPFGAGTMDFEAMFRVLPPEWSGYLDLEIKVRDYAYVSLSVEKLQATLRAIE